MRRTPEEEAQRARLEGVYARAQAPVMRAIERSVCGCDYGATSWTTREEADRFAALLALAPGVRLLEVGAGSGWPGLYLAATTGGAVTLVDLPLSGLRIAAARARADGLACRLAVADATQLPFAEGTFDAVSHSDLLCCLRRKREALAACRRVIGARGRMVFAVISVAPGLSPADEARAVANGPEFVAAEADYRTLLARAGWSPVAEHDLTAGFLASFRRQLSADEARREALTALIGAAELGERATTWRTKIAAVAEGLLRRTLFVAEPAPESGRP